MEKVDILKRTDIFYDLTGPQLEMMASLCEDRSVKLGEIVFEENSNGDEMFVIARGSVEVLVDPTIVGGPSAKKRGSGPVTIATLRSGQSFGEVALVDQGLRTASARCAETETHLLLIPRAKFNKLCDTYPELGYRVMRNIAADLAFKIRGSDLAIREQLLWRPRPND
ncbi:MAG TPA: cyclic nucleotide-binding domain-containing protein [Anaerolineae bacterium]|jgi:CRP/FNR family cyclic AMP-dependent transcriptional regulator|nr:cyclic nucleotide-binding domain-containing protein [Anaerolineae bacterium]